MVRAAKNLSRKVKNIDIRLKNFTDMASFQLCYYEIWQTQYGRKVKNE